MKTLRSCTAGAVAVVSALVMPLLLGFGSLGVEAGHWYLAQRQMQGAADAAAISAAAQYIQDTNAGNPSSTTYQSVGANYALTNGFTIPTANVCLVTASGDNCGTVRSLDSRPTVCRVPPCVVVEITQNTMRWLTTEASMEPSGRITKAIPAPTLLARATVTAKSTTQTVTTTGTDCVLALANDTQAVTVSGANADIRAKCGIAIDGGRDQNRGTPVVGGITFSGSSAKVQINSLVVASNSTNCPDDGTHCQQYCQPAPCTGPALTAVTTKQATPDPYATTVANIFASAPPWGAQTATISAAGAGYTNGTRTFTVTGGTGAPAKILATVTNGKVTAILGVFDPGAYTAMSTNPVSATPDIGTSTTAAKFNLNEGCYTFPGTAVGGVAWTPIPGRKYCSIFASGQQHINFPTGTYWIAGGDRNCVGICMSGSNASMTSDIAGVTFLLTNGEGTGTFGTNSYASVSVKSGSVSLCAPGTNCGTTCVTNGSCLLIVQNPAATPSTASKTPASTDNVFNGNGSNTLSGLIYLPRQTFDNNGTSSIGGCFGVVAKYVFVAGTPTFSNGCLPGSGIGGTTTTTTSLTDPYLYQ